MNKILRYFPLNKKIQKKDVKSLLITVGIYVAVLVAFLIVKKILVTVKIIGTLVYNFSKLYNLYAVVGIILGVITCFTNVDTEEVNYITVEDIKNLYMSDKKKIAWIVTGVAVLAAAIITPTGLKAERLKRAVDKYVAEDHSDEISEKAIEEVKEEVPEVIEEEEVEEVVEVVEEPVFEGPLYERFVPGEELGTYHDDKTGTNFVVYDNGAVYTGGSVNDVLRIPAYLVFGDERYEVKAIADMTEESTWIREVYIPNTITTIGYSCFSNCNDLKKVHMGSSVTYIGEFSFSDSPVGEVHLPLSVYEIGEGAFGKYNKNYARVKVSSEEQAHHLRLQQPDYLQVGVYENLELDEIEDIELSAFELKKPKNESMVITVDVITGDVGGYCGEYFSGFEIKNISEDLLTVAGQNDSYRYMGLLARQTQYPDGTYVYGGTIDATPVVMGRNSFSGTFAIVLQPDGTVYIQNVSGDAFINNDYYSHE